MGKKKDLEIRQIVARNKKAYHDYFIKETLEAGLVLVGTEVKSLRNGKASIIESHADEVDGELYLLGSHIPEYEKARIFNHYPRRPRKLLLRKREVNKLLGLIQKKGMTVVPLAIYFNHKNLAKVELGLAQGKKKHDKRQAIKERDWERSKARVLKDGT